MAVCAQRFPPLVQLAFQQSECWLPDRELSAAERAPLVREEVSVADEA